MRKVFFIFALLTSLAAVCLSADTEIARLYFENGRNLAQTGAKAEALELLDSALRFRPDYADALLLQSRLLAEDPATRKKALEAARMAAGAASWEFYSFREGVLHLSRILADMRLYEEALQCLGRPESLASPASAGEYAIRLRCYRGLGDRKKLEDTLASALAAFPGEPVLLEFFFRTADPLRPETVRRFELLDKNHAASLPAFAAYIQAAADSDGLLTLAWDYFKAGGNDPAVSCLLMQKGAADPEREIERFVSFGGLKRMDLLRSVYASTRQRYPRLLANLLSAFTGTSVLDKDKDGIGEEKFSIQGGKLFLWEIDEDQDGLDELSVEFSEKTLLPSRLVYRSGDSVLSCAYALYPYIEEAMYEGGISGSAPGSRRTLNRILPGVLSLPIFSGGTFQESPEGIPYLFYRLNSELSFLSLERVEAAAYMYEERTAEDPEYTRRVFLRDGVAGRIDIVHGGGEKERVLHRLIFEEGKFACGLRDLDRDGIFDVREFFEDGRLLAAAIDTTGDGKPDYREFFFPEVFKEWDFNGDGIIDAKESRGAGPAYFFPFVQYYGVWGNH
jgi:tetratricopeptide (TPR) repeat protein